MTPATPTVPTARDSSNNSAGAARAGGGGGMPSGPIWDALVVDSDAAVIVMDQNGVAVFCNQQLANMRGEPVEKIVGKSLSERFPAEVAAERLALLRRAAASPRPLVVLETLGGVEVRTVYRALPGTNLVMLMPRPGPHAIDVDADASAGASAPSGDERYEVVRPKFNTPGVLEKLTPGEVTVLRYLAEGLSVEAIAEKIHKSAKTVEYRRSALGRKLGMDNRVELTRFAIQHGLVKMKFGRGGMG